MNGPIQRVVVTDLRIPFTRLVLFFVKVALAAAMAAAIVGFLTILVSAIVAVAFEGSPSFTLRWWPF
jgi:hypothetical protein